MGVLAAGQRLVGSVKKVLLPLGDRGLRHLETPGGLDLGHLTAQNGQHDLHLLVGRFERFASHQNLLDLRAFLLLWKCPRNSDPQQTAYGYDAAGNPTSTTAPTTNGYVETRTYDRAGRIDEVKHTKGAGVLARFDYTLDSVGNPVRVDTSDGPVTYAYDLKDQLKEVCYAASCSGPTDPFIRYDYDDVSNRMSETRPSGATTYSYNADDELLSTASASGTMSYSHDANGNMTTAGSMSFAYDLAGRTKSTTKASDTTAYTYDGLGQRTKAVWGDGPGERTRYLWDPNAPLPNLAIERDGSGALQRRYVHGLDLVSMSTGSSTSYYHHDGLGSVTNLTSASGQPQWNYSYEPFGSIKTEMKADPTAPQNPMRFTGEYLDNTGLYHLRARQYDPGLGRFSSTDPLPAGPSDPYTSSYAYVNNQPTLYVDSSGMFCILGYNPNGSCRGSGSAIYNSDAWYDLNDSVGGLVDGITHIPFTDTSLMGLLRDHMVDGGIALGVNECSWGYGYANRIGRLEQAGLSFLGAASPSSASVLAESYNFGRSSNHFGRWGIGTLNQGSVRVGWGWNNKIGHEVFRISMGGRGHTIWKHIDILKNTNWP